MCARGGGRVCVRAGVQGVRYLCVGLWSSWSSMAVGGLSNRTMSLLTGVMVQVAMETVLLGISVRANSQLSRPRKLDRGKSGVDGDGG